MKIPYYLNTITLDRDGDDNWHCVVPSGTEFDAAPIKIAESRTPLGALLRGLEALRHRPGSIVGEECSGD